MGDSSQMNDFHKTHSEIDQEIENMVSCLHFVPMQTHNFYCTATYTRKSTWFNYNELGYWFFFSGFRCSSYSGSCFKLIAVLLNVSGHNLHSQMKKWMINVDLRWSDKISVILVVGICCFILMNVAYFRKSLTSVQAMAMILSNDDQPQKKIAAAN